MRPSQSVAIYLTTHRPALTAAALSVGLALAALGVTLWLAAPRPAGAAGTVGNGSPGSCNEAALRTALIGGGPVNFNCGPNTVTITLAAPLAITEPTTVDGGGRIVLSGDNVTRVFTVAVGSSLHVMNLTVRDGVGEFGGGIHNRGTLSATNVTFLLNTAGTAGGAVFNTLQSSAFVSGSLFMHNNAQYAALGSGPEVTVAVAAPEGTLNPNDTPLVVHASHFVENSAEVGGAIAAQGAAVTVTDSVFETNEAFAGSAMVVQYGWARIIGSQFVSNTTLSPMFATASPEGDPSQYGGAVHATWPATLEIEDSYFERNTSPYGPGGAVVARGLAAPAETAAPTGALPSVTISNSRFVANASAQHSGGAIYSTGILSIDGSEFEANTAGLECLEGGCSLPLAGNAPEGLSPVGNGGAIFSAGPLSITASTLYSNTGFYGGAVVSVGPGMLLAGSEVVSNVAHQSGGGLLVVGLLRVVDTTLAYNSSEGFGGGAHMEGEPGSLIARSLIYGNAAENGGGFFSSFRLSVVNSTVSANTAEIDGGGIFDSSGLVMTNTTVVSNTALTGVGGNLANHGVVASGAAPQGLTEPMRLVNSLIAFGQASGGPNNCDGQFLDAGNNLESGNDCSLMAGTSLTNTNPLITPLAYRGGPTLVHDLREGSPAVDAGDDGHCPPVDQRGIARPVDGDGVEGAVCDIGAVEYGALFVNVYMPYIAKE